LQTAARMLHAQTGATAIEHAIVVALISLASLGSWTLFGGAIAEKADCAAAAVSGRAGAPCGAGAGPGARALEEPAGGAEERPARGTTAALGAADPDGDAALAGAASGRVSSSDDPTLAAFDYDLEHDRRERTDGGGYRYYVTGGDGVERVIAQTTRAASGARELVVLDPATGQPIAVRRIREDGSRESIDTATTRTGRTVTTVRTGADGFSSTETSTYELCPSCIGSDSAGYRAVRGTGRREERGTLLSSTAVRVTYDAAAGTRTRVSIERDASGRPIAAITVVDGWVDTHTDGIDNDRDGQVDEADETFEDWRRVEYSSWRAAGPTLYRTKTTYTPNGDSFVLIDRGGDGFDSALVTTGRGQTNEYVYRTDATTRTFSVTTTTRLNGTSKVLVTTTVNGHVGDTWLPSRPGGVVLDSLVMRNERGEVMLPDTPDVFLDLAADRLASDPVFQQLLGTMGELRAGSV